MTDASGRGPGRQRPRTALLTAALAATLLLPACAGTFLGGVETVLITSDPPGARVTVDGEPLLTPVLLAVPRDSEPTVTFEGLPPVRVRRTFTLWMWADLPLLFPLWFDRHLLRGDLEPDDLVLRDGRVLDGENGDVLAQAAP